MSYKVFEYGRTDVLIIECIRFPVAKIFWFVNDFFFHLRRKVERLADLGSVTENHADARPPCQNGWGVGMSRVTDVDQGSSRSGAMNLVWIWRAIVWFGSLTTGNLIHSIWSRVYRVREPF
jgi:hypothetical protein